MYPLSIHVAIATIQKLQNCNQILPVGRVVDVITDVNWDFKAV